MLLNLYSILLTLVTVIVRHVEPGRIEEKNMFRHKKKKKAIYINKQQIEHFQMSPLAVLPWPCMALFCQCGYCFLAGRQLLDMFYCASQSGSDK